MDDHKPLITKNQAIFLTHQSKKRVENKVKKKRFIIKELILIILTFLTIFIAANYPAFSALVKYQVNKPTTNKISIAKPPVVNPQNNQPVIIPIATNESTKISIPKISIEGPIIWDIAFKDIHENLNNGVVHYAETAHPGEYGNMFIVGHSSDYVWSKGKYKNIFALLPKLTTGDQIQITYYNINYVYEVTNTQIVAPTNMTILKPTTDPTLTLMTCWPIGTSQKRYVVRAKLISPSPKGTQSTSPSTLNLPKAR